MNNRISSAFRRICGVIVLSLLAQQILFAASIEVLNPSFEYVGGVPVGVKTMGVKPDDWSFGNGMPTGGGIEGPSSEGAVCVAVNNIDSVYQLTGHTVSEGDEYTLKFDSYFLWSTTSTWECTFQGKLYYDNGGSRTEIDHIESNLNVGPNGDYTWHYDYTLTTTIPAGHAAIDNKLGVELVVTDNAGIGATWFGFDNVRLLATEPPPPPHTEAAIFYIDSATGSDSNTGLATDQAWASLTPVNATTFIPGDRILFKAGTSYTGLLKPTGSGTAGNPIMIDRYGTGSKPAINGGGILDAVLLENVEYYEVSNLKITNLGPSRQDWRTGIKLWAYNSGTLNHIHLKNLDVYDVNGSLDKNVEGCGIFIQSSGSTLSRFDDVLVENCHVLRTDRNGICMRSSFTNRSSNWFPSLNVVIRGNLVEDCGGDAIKPWGADGCLIEYNRVDGARERCTDAAAGIWPWSSDDTLIQYNEVSGVKGTFDGQGFDSDYNCQDTVFQYNYSHDNEGGFMLVCGPNITGSNIGTLRTIIRYNISQNDGVNTARVFHISGASVRDTYIYNNVIYISPSQDIPLLLYGNWDDWADNTQFYNNIFYVAYGGRATYNLGGSTNNFFENNVFYGNHSSPPSGTNNTTSDPQMVSAGSGGDGLNTVDGYKLQTGSPCIASGRTVSENGNFDYFRNRLDPAYLPDRGVHAYTHTYPGDIDTDHDVDGDDLGLFMPEWLGVFFNADLNGDGRVDIADYCFLAQDWQESF